ncbi:cysteine--tRNA ligase [Ureaplasma parvum]|uniref:Cysteine--tRNA ligase n=2 Tax=Ureaplasma parvum serovar 3 TaxID=38504 RepID=SYC_UREPA|nr:cysteine--tRNA ligase [Ureaplasma parvum]Q9PR21.1 RecName: Full=Cysteine--tRNA ligase; AltName: Full=Cysteinyl-tRNA synthetase; Short=CysRS [Ureaplasma parvum serovar 3 str. ATCC 700970]pir/H82930/ cysteinyl-tRNA synthetase UU123 [imported] - Ureaplasma urealyticum [Ureaplasma urealyticum]AAF30529.1 cysteinyl-tRNA synthetase [Ureaplasma parvum serovar 3 str. ATCC 700970]ACA32785.1 cysteinyl-tRNA synthetase [Ureaplasma parvum serovar 3 str. ATCC 27815]EDT87632.1 cysteinyl-tRNA synthetase [Ur
MKLYDSYSNQLVEINDELISIYNCGPTVYNHIHIGNARPLITMDVLYRFLKKHNIKTKYVLNITDIDDKIINYALANNLKELEVSEYYFNEYLKIKKALNTLEMINPKVSTHMDKIIDYIQKLIDKQAGYFIGDDVYFDTKKALNYGQLSKRDLENDIVGMRIESAANKHNPNDFILWKKTNKGIMWNTPWGIGRPGWHSECSCLINTYIGEQVSIHGGGIDLKFPHHENENAQNQVLYNKNLAKVWMHFGLVNINNEKMSKSLNNFILVKDLLAEYDYQVVRWFFYQADYKQPIKFSHEIMKQNEKEILKIKNAIYNAKNYLYFNNQLKSLTQIDHFELFDERINDDLDFVGIVDLIHISVKKINILIKENKDMNELKLNLTQLLYMLDILGINFVDLHNDENLALLNTWKNYVDKKDYVKADELRKQLINIGIL